MLFPTYNSTFHFSNWKILSLAFLFVLPGVGNFAFAQRAISSTSVVKPTAEKTSNNQVTIAWEGVKKCFYNENSYRSVLSFKEADYDAHSKALPAVSLVKNLSLGKQGMLELYNLVWESMPEADLAGVEGLVDLGSEIIVNQQTSLNRKSPVFRAWFVPVVKEGNSYKRLVSYSYTIKEIAAKPVSATARIHKNNSVLANGEWYKIAIVNQGVYKLDFSFFKEIGVDVKTLNPATIRLYGNGGALLPFKNSAYRADDLEENAIYVEGESDGRFDSLDYVLFYGQGTQRWLSDGTSCLGYSSQLNLYSDTAYYFINVNKGQGKRWSAFIQPSAPITDEVSEFDDLQYHEKELVNLIKSGRDFYGEIFDVVTSQTFEFKFPNLVQSKPVSIKAALSSRCVGCSSSYTLTALNTTLNKQVTLPPAPTVYYGDYVTLSNYCGTFSSSTNTVQVNITYNKSNDAFGYLNYLELKARRELKIAENQFSFRDLSVVGAGKVINFHLGNYSTNYKVLNLRNPLNPELVNGVLTGSELTFKSPADSIAEFFVFNTDLGLMRPIAKGKVANQNLHALPQVNYVIVAHPMFKAEAERLGQLHNETDSLSYVVATTEEIYNEFSSGAPDVTGIKDFVKMFYDRATSNSEMPKYLLLFGDGSYDNRTISPTNTNFIPTYQSDNSTQPTGSYVSEDYFGLLDDTEGDAVSDLVDIGIGRFPVKNLEEAKGVVDKIKSYMNPTSYFDKLGAGPSCTEGSSLEKYGFGDWRNVVTFIADDQDNATHMGQADDISTLVDSTYPVVNIDKIYLDAYKQEVTAGGQRYPDVNEAINRRIDKGALIVNYTGHGGETGWTGERILDMAMVQNWTNLENLPLFVTATCEFSRFDDPGRTSAGELVLLNKKGGGIGLLTTTRLVYSNPNYYLNINFYKHVFDTINGSMGRLGDVIRLTKVNSSVSVNNRNFTLLGDPALRLAYPQNQVLTTHVNNTPINTFADTVKALNRIKVKGIVADKAGNKMSDFTGIVYPIVYDKAITYTSLGNDGPPDPTPKTNFVLQKNIIYRGKVTVVKGEFEFSFVVPKDIAYNIGPGKISYYAENSKVDANGFNNQLMIGGFDTSAVADNAGPEIKLFMNDEKFVSGGLTNETPSIYGVLMDENGINTVGNGIGHDLTAVVDANTEKTLVLNDYYQAELNSFQKGTVRYKLKDLSEGPHTVKLKAWDVYNNSNEVSVDFVVSTSAELALSHVLNYPNPFTTRTEFFFEHNKCCTYLLVNVEVFTVSGKLVKTIETTSFANSYRSEGIEWDGRDDYGDKLGRGVYVYKIKVRAADGSVAEKYEKLVLLQ